MKCLAKKLLVVLFAMTFVLMWPLASELSVSGEGGFAFAAVGSLDEGEEITYDKSGGVLSSLGFDTSQMPSTYNADATTNPYGSDVSTMEEIKEIIRFDTYYDKSGAPNPDPTGHLFGHNARLDGEYDTLYRSGETKDIDFLDKQPYIATAKCDLKASGRDSYLAIVYTNYDHEVEMNDPGNLDPGIYLRIYDPTAGNGRVSDPIKVGEIPLFANPDPAHIQHSIRDFLVQSQIQVSAGDYDKDSIDEIAVYSPATSSSSRAKVVIYDLAEGQDSADPLSFASWRAAWNYVLPISNQEVISISRNPAHPLFAKNMYNNIDLSSGDADNDGICDLVVSYGASDTNYLYDMFLEKKYDQTIKRSIPSRSVLLYGDDRGQMLKNSQNLDFGDSSLIRVSFAFGDTNGDGNEEMYFGGQLQSEQEDNTTRALGLFHYDDNENSMVLENIKDMNIINGGYDDKDKQFHTQNGWDGEYHSSPLMKTNIAIGNFMGAGDNTKIYMDSVLYSVDDGDFQIVDELEDKSEDDDNKALGSQVFTDMMGYWDEADTPSNYYEFGADSGNFTGGLNDYVLVNRVSVQKKSSSQVNMEKKEAVASVLLKEGEDENAVFTAKHKGKKYDNATNGSPVHIAVVDTDKDSSVATYTGQHQINYSNPEVFAVLMSPPYYKDVAAYDEGKMLDFCGTSYGVKTGNTEGTSGTFALQAGAFANIEIGAKEGWRFKGHVGLGYARTETWAEDLEYDYEISYSTAGGEDAVVLYSTPQENFVYKVESVIMDDDGTYEEATQFTTIPIDHKPVKQVLTLDDYQDVQARYPKDLPDMTDLVQSEPGYPGTYPKSETDIPKKAKELLDKTEENKQNGYRIGEDWSGLSYGSGAETQNLSYQKQTSKGVENGGYFEIEIGGVNAFDGFLCFDYFDAGAHFDFTLTEGNTSSRIGGYECSGTVVNMPMAAKGYGYDFSWKLFEYDLKYKNQNDRVFRFPVVTYIVDDVVSPAVLPDTITQDWDKTTDSELTLNWDYSAGDPREFKVYRYKDFPVGGGDTLVGTVAGSDYRIKKDDNGNTVKDKKGRVVREYSFTDKGLTADTKYQYRIKAIGTTIPVESIFSPVFEGRTFVSTKPDVSLSADDLTIYPDGTYDLVARLADPENYQKDIAYQWQKYDEKKRKWEDLNGRNKQKLCFYNCEDDDEGKYRCRINLTRMVEGRPQYITAFTDSCDVKYSLRSVEFGDIRVFDGTGQAATNTGISVKVSNKSSSSLAKPTGNVLFTITGPNGTFRVCGKIDEETGIVSIPSIEERIGTVGQKNFVDGGYLITANYTGNAIFYPADDPEEYHYLRNIDESMFLSMESAYFFGEDLAKTTNLYDYKKDGAGRISRDDYTDKIKLLKLYQVDATGAKTGEPETIDLSETGGKAYMPLNEKFVGKAYVEAYINEGGAPAAKTVIKTKKIQLGIAIKERMTGTGDLLELVTSKDLMFSEDDFDPDEKNIVTGDEKKSLSDFMVYKYYEKNGDYMFDSSAAPDRKDEFIPAEYYVKPVFASGNVSKFYDPTFYSAKFTVVGNFYLVSASTKDKNTGSVEMIAPDKDRDFTDRGYAGGTKLTLKAVPNPGFRVSKWLIDECGEKTTTLPGTDKIDYVVKGANTTGNGKIDIKAVLEPKENTLTFGVKGSGRISLEPERIKTGDIVLAGTNLNFTATPEPGWKFKEWRWSNVGGSDSVSGGSQQEDGTNTKSYTMPDNSASLYAVFRKASIDVAIPNDAELTYINDGSDPLAAPGEEIKTDKGKDVPIGVQVYVTLKPGIELAPNAVWAVQAMTETGVRDLEVTETLHNGRPACKFTLTDPADPDVPITGCTVMTDTVKGRYTVQARNEYEDRVDFTIFVDGNEVQGNPVSDVEAGSQIDVKAKLRRGYKIDFWNVNGQNVEVKDNTYSTVLTGNTIVQTSTSKDDAVSLKLKAEGGGKGQYVITGKNGETIKETFEGSDETVVSPGPYKGESVVISAADDEADYTMTAATVNGEDVELEDGRIEIEELDEDTEITVRFRPNAYLNVDFIRNTKKYDAQVFDEADSLIEEGETIKAGKGEAVNFSVVIDKDSPLIVEATGGYVGRLTPVEDPVLQPDGKSRKYSYTLKNFKADTQVTIYDHNIMYITNARELKEYFEALVANENNPDSQPDGILINNIKGPVQINDVPRQYAGTFDGQGHYMWDVSFGSSERCIHGFYGVFGNLLPGSCVKDVTLFDVDVYGSAPDSLGYSGMITYNNQGTISNLAITSAIGSPLFSLEFSEGAAAIAYDNHGTIENCLVKGLEIEAREYAYYAYAVGISVFNQRHDGLVDGKGVIRNCYVEDVRFREHGAESGELLKRNVISRDNTNKHYGEFKDNYFREEYDSYCEHGINVYSLTENPSDQQSAEEEVETPEFARKLAWTMNDKLGDKIWGLCDSDQGDREIWHILLTYPDMLLRVAPIKVDFVSTKPTITRYYQPGLVDLPNCPYSIIETYVGWVIDGVAYDVQEDTPAKVELLTDQVVEMAINPDEWPISLSHGATGADPFDIRNYQDLRKAVKDAEADPGLFEQRLFIRRYVTMEGFTFTLSEKTRMEFEDGANFTINEDAQIINYGAINFSSGSGSSKYYKFGTIVNYGRIDIKPNCLYNHGSKFDNHEPGVINLRPNIICLPHIDTGWVYADAPETEGEHKDEWKMTSRCSVCEAELTDYIKPDPPKSKVESIYIWRPPENTGFEVGENFDTNGMIVVATLTDGTKAVVTKYDMELTLDEGEPVAIKDGDALNKEGDGIVSVKYGNAETSFSIAVINTDDLLQVTDENGDKITEKEMEPGKELDLNASLKKELPYRTGFTWESSDPDVAALDAGTGDKNKVTTRDPGTATITVKVVNENGNPITAIEPKKVLITNVSHITSLKILGGDISVDKDDSYQVPVDVKPANTTDILTWSTSDEKVVTVDENGVLTGVGGGTATVMVRAPSGMSDTKKVFVYEKAEDLVIEPEEQDVKLNGYGAISARVPNAKANGEVRWTVDDPDTAGFYVKNEETDEMEVVKEAVTRLSGDGTGASDAYVVITGVSNGTATVTASVESVTGGTIEKECRITVKESDEFVRITYNGAPASGETLKFRLLEDKNYNYVMLDAVSSFDGDSFTWTSIDDTEDPVIRVNSSGKVTFLRTGTATVILTSNTTGATDICMIKVYIEATGIELSDTKLELKKGDEHEIKATLMPEGAEEKVIWKSSDEKVATVSSDGKVKAVSGGTATITAQIKGSKIAPKTCEVTVTEEPVVVSLPVKNLMLKTGHTTALTATITPKDAEGEIIWKSSNEKVAKVSKDGLITAVSGGEATITASFSKPGSTPASCKITVYDEPEPSSIVEVELSKDQLKLKKGSSGKLTAKVKPSGSKGKITWTSSDPAVATVSADGTVKGIKQGAAIITASFSQAGSKDATCMVDVYTTKLSIKLSKKSYTYNGKKKLPKITVKSGNTVLAKNITKSNNKVIVIRNGGGSKLPGTYQLTVIARDWHYGSGAASYKIKVKPTKMKKIKKNKRRQITVRWKKVGKKYIKGYKIRYSLKKNMKNAKYKTVKKYNKTKLTIKRLKGGKKYYVQVRTFYRSRGVYYYSKWTKAKAVKVRK